MTLSGNSAWDRLPPASYDGITFPVDEVDIKGGMRHHLHEYPHAPGAAFEVLGRRLYEVRMRANFQETFRKYPNLWPVKLDRLRGLFELGEANDLVIPTIGTISAICVDWTQNMGAKIRSGERAEFTFIENSNQTFLFAALAQSSIRALPQLGERFSQEAEKFPSTPLFDAITDSVNSVLAVADFGQAVASLFIAKLLALDGLLEKADRTLDFLNDPKNAQMLNDLHNLWDSVRSRLLDLQQKGPRMVPYVTPMLMSVSQVSIAIFGDTSHAMEILQTNPIYDAFAIPASTLLRIYQPNATLGGAQ